MPSVIPTCRRVEGGEEAGTQARGLLRRERLTLFGHLEHFGTREELQRPLGNDRREQRTDVDPHVEDAVGRVLERAVGRVEIADHRRDVGLEKTVAGEDQAQSEIKRGDRSEPEHRVAGDEEDPADEHRPAVSQKLVGQPPADQWSGIDEHQVVRPETGRLGLGPAEPAALEVERHHRGRRVEAEPLPHLGGEQDVKALRMTILPPRRGGRQSSLVVTTVCDMGCYLDGNPGGKRSPASDQINGSRAKSQDPCRPQGSGNSSGRSRSCLSQRKNSGMQATGPGSAKEQGGPDQLGVVGVDRHVVGDAFEPGSFDADASVARAVSQFVEQIRQVGRGRLRQSAEDAGLRVTRSIRPSIWALASRVRKPRSPATMWYGRPCATRPPIQFLQERASRQHVLGGLAEPVGEIHHGLGRILAVDRLKPVHELDHRLHLGQVASLDSRARSGSASGHRAPASPRPRRATSPGAHPSSAPRSTRGACP